MNLVRLLDLVDSFSMPVLFLVFLVGLTKTAPPNKIRRLYSVRVNLLSFLPFNTRWQHEIAPEHLDAFRKSRRWFFAFLTATFAVGLLRITYAELFFARLHGLDLKNMSLHIEYTDLRPENDADKARAASLVTDLQHALAKYQDYRIAEADGFEPFHPEFKVPEVGFWKRSSDPKSAFSISDPTSLLYQPTSDGGYKLVGATYIDQNDTGEDQLDQLVPLSVARWHRDVNLCLPARSTDKKTVDGTKFGFNGSIATRQACDAAGGKFYPQLSGWTLQVRPWEQNPKLVWEH
ncbi:MAG: hypothetical protein WCD12_21815 [Candidatus Binatus sp.]|uniref:hypothetical protein n=1 Tax=Candidatus Binatus sp. TaxID=2811406 RepID=UPI003C77CD86